MIPAGAQQKGVRRSAEADVAARARRIVRARAVRLDEKPRRAERHSVRTDATQRDSSLIRRPDSPALLSPRLVVRHSFFGCGRFPSDRAYTRPRTPFRAARSPG